MKSWQVLFTKGTQFKWFAKNQIISERGTVDLNDTLNGLNKKSSNVGL